MQTLALQWAAFTGEGLRGLGVEILRNRNPLRRPPPFSSTNILENADSSTSAAMRYVSSLKTYPPIR